MSAKARACRTCASELVPGEEPEAVGLADQVQVRMGPVPYLACPAGHGKVYAYPTFGAELRGLLKVPATRRGLLRGDPRCRACGLRLPPSMKTMPEQFQLNLVLRDPDRIHVSLLYQAVQCPRCGTRQALARRRLESNLTEAVVRALEGIGLAPA